MTPHHAQTEITIAAHRLQFQTSQSFTLAYLLAQPDPATFLSDLLDELTHRLDTVQRISLTPKPPPANETTRRLLE